MDVIAKTHTGRIRTNNEDFFIVDKDTDVVIVADGVGGYDYGEVASKLAAESCMLYLLDENPIQFAPDPEKTISNAIKFANEKVITLQKNQPRYKNMGTTLSALHIQSGVAYFSYVGDSRIYLIKNGNAQLVQLSTDHTLDKNKLDKNLSPALYKRSSSILTRMVGSMLLLTPDSGKIPVQSGDLLLACTDGLSDLVSDEQLHDCILRSNNDLEKAVDLLIDKALDHGGRDNVTAALIRC